MSIRTTLPVGVLLEGSLTRGGVCEEPTGRRVDVLRVCSWSSGSIPNRVLQYSVDVLPLPIEGERT